MKVITVATEKSGYYYSLEESALKFNYDFILLGYGMEWKGFGWRLHLIMNYLKTLHSDEVIMVVDAYDVILLRNSKDLLNEFISMNASFICGSFRKLDGILGVLQEQEFGFSKKILPLPYNNICAGTWISTVSKALNIYENPNYQIDYNEDDQILLNKIFDDEGIICVTPDTNFQIFCTVFPSILTRNIRDIDKIIVTKDKKLKCGVTNTEPYVIHGLANTHLSHLLQELGFKNYKDLTPSTYIIKKFWYHISLIVQMCIQKIFKF